ncbi:MAG: hypothetical protein KC635_27055, partial [Myxococcales bacterium]|nr:hypothetical protein [Myxococcales bacterium]
MTHATASHEPPPNAGLFGPAGAVPLEAVAIEAVLDGPALDVAVRQRYRNDGAGPIEAVYLFPLEEGAAVRGFSATLGDGTVVDGVVEERERAYERYDDAIAEGHTA